MAKSESLPEKSITSGYIASTAKQLADIHTQLASLQTQEKELKSRLADLCNQDRETELDANTYVGLYRLIPEDAAPSRVEFRLESRGKVDKRVLELEEKETLDGLLGSANRAVLFEEVWRTGDIHDPCQLIVDVSNAGIDPVEVLDVSVKPGCERRVAEASEAVDSFHVLMPKKGFLSTLNEIRSNITDKARNYIKAYLAETLGTKVCPGTNG